MATYNVEEHNRTHARRNAAIAILAKATTP